MNVCNRLKEEFMNETGLCLYLMKKNNFCRSAILKIKFYN